MMPVAPFWSVMFFVMLFTLGVDSQFGMLETGVTALVDEFHVLRKGRRKVIVVAVACVILFILGLPQCSPVSQSLAAINTISSSLFLADRTNGRAYATVLLPSVVVVCNVCIVAKR